jgi:F-type H+-transporting ATPase subunit gamma
MSETLAGLRHKIDGADKLQIVVRTMKTVAASSIGQYSAAVGALQEYERAVTRGLGVCFRQTGRQPPERPPADGVGAIVFGSDQGLVGQFNELLADFVVKTLQPLPGKKTVWAVGERIHSQLEASGLSPEGKFQVPGSVAAITRLVGDVQLASESRRARGDYGQLYVFHNCPRGGSQYEPVQQRLLPLDRSWQAGLAKIPWPQKEVLPELLLDLETTLRTLIREFLFISLYKACAESLASENAARLAAMTRAEKNIKDRSAELKQTFSRLRQSSIDEELFDVIAGFNALTPP